MEATKPLMCQRCHCTDTEARWFYSPKFSSVCHTCILLLRAKGEDAAEATFQIGELVEWQGQQGRVKRIYSAMLAVDFAGYTQNVDKSEVKRVTNKSSVEVAGAVNVHGFSTDYNTRKNQPIVTGVLDYFPLAILAVAEVSQDGNQQHNAGQPLHWAREKSQDEINTALRHIQERGSHDGKVRHLAKAAWRILAALQKEIEQDLCPSMQCEVHVLNKDCGGCCSLLPRAATWYGRNRDGKKVLP